MEAKAINRYVGTSPRKMRLVIDLIRDLKLSKQG
jgi:ribosomal protein L22